MTVVSHSGDEKNNTTFLKDSVQTLYFLRCFLPFLNSLLVCQIYPHFPI